MTIELKPCPFCGEAAEVVVLTNQGMCIRCSSCYCRTPWHDDDGDKNFAFGTKSAFERTLTEWNRRVFEP